MTASADWTGRVGEVWAEEWRATDRSFAHLEPQLLATILAVAPDEPGRWLDIGCGAGTTTLGVAAARPDAEVIGADLSPALLAIAADRAGRPSKARFVRDDATAVAADHAPLALLFSRHGVMFFDDPPCAFAALAAAAAAPGAPLVFSCFAAAADNPWARETLAAVAPDGPLPGAGSGPFAFADPGHVAALLEASGWRAGAPLRATYRYVAGAGADAVVEAVRFFGRVGPTASTLRQLPAAARDAALERLAALCDSRRIGEEVVFPATAWLWTAFRT